MLGFRMEPELIVTSMQDSVLEVAIWSLSYRPGYELKYAGEKGVCGLQISINQNGYVPMNFGLQGHDVLDQGEDVVDGLLLVELGYYCGEPIPQLGLFTSPS